VKVRIIMHNVLFQSIKWTFPSEGGGRHRKILQYSSILQEFLKLIM
jgi:hypothetical protein